MLTGVKSLHPFEQAHGMQIHTNMLCVHLHVGVDADHKFAFGHSGILKLHHVYMYMCVKKDDSDRMRERPHILAKPANV